MQEYHVALTGRDSNDGSQSAPLLTISAAAAIAQPGDTITVHEGTYRERIDPPRGGTSDDCRITYQTPPGEQVVIKGSERVSGWVHVEDSAWRVDLPNSIFGAFNPFADLIHGDWYEADQAYHTGAVYLNGHWLREAAAKHQVLRSEAPEVSADGRANLVNFSGLFLGNSESGTIAAATACAASRAFGTNQDADSSFIGPLCQDDWLAYDIDFGKESTFLSVLLASPDSMSRVEIRKDTVDGELIGTCQGGITAEWSHFQPYRASITPQSGIQRIVFIFAARSDTRPADEEAIGWWFAQAGETTTTIWADFHGNDPNRELVEVNVRQSVFYPSQVGRNYITVSGFTLEQAATPWAPPTAQQIGLIGTHWSKGWIIEHNTIRYATCTGVSLGKFGDEHDNTYQFPQSIKRAVEQGWSRDTVGGHIVRGNQILHCGQCGINGSLGAAFSTIIGNSIHDIRQNHHYKGCETAGIKLHGAVDVLIRDNHIYCCEHWGGIWLDWMAQGARVAGNLLHDNSQDLMLEVNHGPHLIDNNLFLSGRQVTEASGGGAFVHNLWSADIVIWAQMANRVTPFFQPHSLTIAGWSNVNQDDERFLNNIIIGPKGTSAYDEYGFAITSAGNVFLAGAKASKHDQYAIEADGFDPELKLEKRTDGWWLKMKVDPAWQSAVRRQIITTESLGKAVVNDAPYEQADGTPYRLDTDYFGNQRSATDLAPGPFVLSNESAISLKVWPKIDR